MGLLRFLLRNLLRNKRRSVLTIVSLGFSIFIVNTLASVLRGFEGTDVDASSQLRLLTRHKVSLTNLLPESYWAKIREVPHVTAVTPWSWYGGIYKDETPGSADFFARFAADPDGYLAVTAGDRFTPTDQISEWRKDRTGALVGQSLFDKQGWRLGDKIVIKGDIYPVDLELTLRGIFRASSREDENAVVFQHLYLEELQGRPGRAGTYWLRVDAPWNVPVVTRAVDRMFENSDAETLTETEQQFAADFVSMLGNIKALITSLSLVVGVAILMVSANTMAMAVRERTTEVAVMKAIGFPPAKILFGIVAESLVIAAFAWIVACALSIALFNMTGFKLPMLWTPMGLTIETAMLSAGAALAIGLVSGLVPGFLAARLPVVEGLRKVA